MTYFLTQKKTPQILQNMCRNYSRTFFSPDHAAMKFFIPPPKKKKNLIHSATTCVVWQFIIFSPALCRSLTKNKLLNMSKNMSKIIILHTAAAGRG